jgi:hypothetical protein
MSITTSTAGDGGGLVPVVNVDELERRVSALERWRTSTTGSAIAIGGAIATAVAAYLAHGGAT